MSKPISRKEKIKRAGREKRVDVQSKKVGKFAKELEKLEKRIKKLEDKA